MVKAAKTKQRKKVSITAATSIYTQIINGCGVCIFGPDTINYPIVDSLEKDLQGLLGWDPGTGGPTSETLKEMELDSLF